MASKNSVKIYLKNGYYHIYNRGVNKQKIFEEEIDYGVFLSYLKEYLLPRNEDALRQKLADPMTNYKEKEKIVQALRLNNFSNEITLLCYVLMPNHFHFLIKQTSEMAIDKFMNSLGVRYSLYFNRKYKRVGTLYQDVFKAVLIDSDEQLLYLTNYIHRNPLAKNLASTGDVCRGCLSQPSSLPEYLGQRKTEWIHPEEILNFFSKTNPQLDYSKKSSAYQSFVTQSPDYSIIAKAFLDEELY